MELIPFSFYVLIAWMKVVIALYCWKMLKLNWPKWIGNLQNMKMKISHARFLIPGSSADLNLDFPRCLEKQISSVSNDVPGNIMEKSRSLLFSFPNVSREWPWHAKPSVLVFLEKYSVLSMVWEFIIFLSTGC